MSHSLDTLHTEIFQSIFLACLNTNLPLTSRHIHQKLTSPSLKRQFHIPANKKTELFIFPRNGHDGEACLRIERELKRITGIENLHVDVNPNNGCIVSWLVEANSLQREEVRRIEGVDWMMESLYASGLLKVRWLGLVREKVDSRKTNNSWIENVYKEEWNFFSLLRLFFLLLLPYSWIMVLRWRKVPPWYWVRMNLTEASDFHEQGALFCDFGVTKLMAF